MRKNANGFRGKVCIVGIGEVISGKFPERECYQSAMDACVRAIQNAGIDKNEIDIILSTQTAFSSQHSSQLVFSELVEELGLQGKAKANIEVFIGGSSGSALLKTACGLISSGLGRCVLCVHSDKVGSAPVGEMIELFAGAGTPDEWETPYGSFMAVSGGLIGTRYMYETGTTPEQMASVVVSMRKWASLNPNALLRREITIDEILGSRIVTTPLHTKECSVLVDGGAAFIVTTSERAKGLPTIPVYPLGFGSRVHRYSISQDFNITKLGFSEAVREAYEMAGIGPQDVDIAELYDGYPVLPLIALEGLGFCKKGEAGGFVAEGNTWPGGKLPMTTNGGTLGQGHSAAGGGIAILVEAVRQLKGEADVRQVKNAKIAVQTSHGGTYMDTHVCILGKECHE